MLIRCLNNCYCYCFRVPDASKNSFLLNNLGHENEKFIASQNNEIKVKHNAYIIYMWKLAGN